MGVIVKDMDSVEMLNSLLHKYAAYIIGRMGIPYTRKGVHVISVALDAPQDVLSALSGKIGRLPGIGVKTAYSDVITQEEDGK
jgi:putative iron-only hydrogenase system regulator